MICPKCDTLMDSCGYGDAKCPECGHMEYAESQEDFDARMGRGPLDETRKDE